MKTRLRKILSVFRKDDGFTFMEIMIVVAIIALFIVLVGPRLIELPQKARVTKCKQEIVNIKTALEAYNLDNATYPTTEQGLMALVQAPTTDPIPANYSSNGYLEAKREPKDPWGSPYLYRCPGDDSRAFEIISLGADRKEGGEKLNADIKDWEIQ